MGGHGNQLFQYAVGRYLAKKHGVDLKLDLSAYDNMAPQDTPRRYELDCYPLKSSIATPKDLENVEPDEFRNNFFGKVRHKLRLGTHTWKVGEASAGFNKYVLSASRNSYLVGWWQCERYFKSIRGDLLKELEPKAPLNRKNKELINRMKDTESVWLHVRRGDYVTNKHASAFHGLTGLDYYQISLSYLVSKLPENRRGSVELFVSSDDISWCKKNFKFPYPISYIENELGSDDMRVAKHCKHDIIANSSFSWWGAWLNDNPEKIVIAPKVWFQDKKSNAETDIVPNNWIRL